MSTDKIEIAVEAVKVIALSAVLVFIFCDAAYPEVFWKSAGILFKGAIIGFAYFVGRYFADLYKKGWKNYAVLFYGIGVITVLAWAGLGTHTEGGDPLFGGGDTVVHFVPTSLERANHAVTIFLSLLIPAFYGMYKKQNSH